MSASIPELSPLGPPDPTIPKAAAMIGVSDRSMRRLVEKGEVEAYELCGTRVKLASLHLFVQRRRSTPLKLLPPPGPGQKRPRGRPRKPEAAA
jgi:hypothetical protein